MSDKVVKAGKGYEMQHEMFHESLSDALKEVIKHLGGTKAIGVKMRPEKSADDAARWVNDCLNADRRERFYPEQVMWLLREGRAIGCHSAMNYLCAEAGYSNAQPIEPLDELAELQRQFIEAAKSVNRMADKIERLQSHPHLARAA